MQRDRGLVVKTKKNDCGNNYQELDIIIANVNDQSIIDKIKANCSGLSDEEMQAYLTKSHIADILSSELKEKVISDMAIQAADNKEKINLKHPYSETLLFEKKRDSWVECGTLADNKCSTNAAKTKFKYYPGVDSRKTRLSEGAYHILGGIVLGNSEEDLSRKLFFRNLK